MSIIGDKSSFAFEIGDYQNAEHTLRHVDIWAGGVRLCTDDCIAYVDQFANDLADELTKDYSVTPYAMYLTGLSPVEMAEFVCSTRDASSLNYDIEGDEIYPFYRFLDLGATTDNLSSFLFRTHNTSFFAYSFWREAQRDGIQEEYQVVKLDFEDLLSISQRALNTLLDT